MGEDANRFRQRARDCRKVADEAKDADWKESLLDLAKDLDDEADKLDSEED